MLLRFVWTSRRGRAFVVRTVRGSQRNQEERQLAKSAKLSSNKQEATRGGTRTRGTGSSEQSPERRQIRPPPSQPRPRNPQKKPLHQKIQRRTRSSNCCAPARSLYRGDPEGNGLATSQCAGVLVWDGEETPRAQIAVREASRRGAALLDRSALMGRVGAKALTPGTLPGSNLRLSGSDRSPSLNSALSGAQCLGVGRHRRR